MTQKLCTANCLYAVDGHCRLENRFGERQQACPHYEGAHYLGGMISHE